MTRHATPSISPHSRLAQALERAYNSDGLKQFARLLGIKGPTRKADIANALAEAMLGSDGDQPRLERMWSQLDAIQQAAIAEVIHGDGFNQRRFFGKYGESPRWRHAHGRHANKRTLLGLFLFEQSVAGSRDSIIGVPEPLKTRLVEFVPPPRAERLITIDEPTRPRRRANKDRPLVLSHTELVAQRELLAVLRLVDAGRLRVGEKTKRPVKQTTSAVAAILDHGDFYSPEQHNTSWGNDIGWIRAFAWPLIVQAAGLAKASGTKLALTSAGRKALRNPPDTLRHAWKKWLATTLIDEFSRVDVIKGQGNKRRMTAVAGRRQVIHRVLASCPVERWIQIDEFWRHMQATGSSFGVTHDVWRLYITDSHYGSLGYSGCHDWSILQGRYILALLFEYAATMGLIDVAYSSPVTARNDFAGLWGTDDLEFLSRYDGLMYFRVNSLGAYILGVSSQYEPSVRQPRTSLKVSPNLDIVATGGAFNVADESFLAVFCARRSDAVFSLDRARSIEAVEKGHQVAELESFLRRACGDDIPAAAARFLDELSKRSKMLSIAGHGLLVRCADDEIAMLIANDRNAGRHCMLAENHTLVVPVQSEKKFKKAAFELGYPVRLDVGRER